MLFTRLTSKYTHHSTKFCYCSARRGCKNKDDQCLPPFHLWNKNDNQWFEHSEIEWGNNWYTGGIQREITFSMNQRIMRAKKECIQTRWIKCITTIVDALSVPITNWDYSFLSDLPDSRFSPALHYPKSIIPNANKVIFLKLKKLYGPFTRFKAFRSLPFHLISCTTSLCVHHTKHLILPWTP